MTLSLACRRHAFSCASLLSTEKALYYYLPLIKLGLATTKLPFFTNNREILLLLHDLLHFTSLSLCLSLAFEAIYKLGRRFDCERPSILLLSVLPSVFSSSRSLRHSKLSLKRKREVKKYKPKA